MILDDDARVYLRGDITIGADPTTSAVLLEIGGTVYPASWDGDAVQTTAWDECQRATVTRWVRTARTDARFVGSSRPAVDNDVKLAAGTYVAQWIVTLDDAEVVPAGPDHLTIQ